MPRFISDGGVLMPGKEKVAIINPETGEPEIYEGPDRAALELLKELDAAEDGYIGQHFTENTDMFELARMKGYDTVEQYVEKMGYNSEKAKELVEKYKQKYHTHKNPERKKVKTIPGGGMNTAPGGGVEDRLGGFGEPPIEN